MSGNPIYIHDVATCVPENYYTQDFAIDFQQTLICDSFKKKKFLQKVYEGSAIEKRHTVIGDYGKSPEEYTFYPKNETLRPEPDTMTRNDLYIKESNRLSAKAVTDLFTKLPAGIKDSITHVITVSCTGFSAPGFDLHIQKTFKLPRIVDRFHIGFMGCYAAFPAMKMARTICMANPDARVLIVNVELCSLHYQQRFEPEIVVANAIFADGITAVMVSGHPDDSNGAKIVLDSFISYYIEDSEADMAWKIGVHGFDMKLSYMVPEKINNRILPIMDELFGRTGLSKDAIDIWAVHPGGKAILKKLAKTLKLSDKDFGFSYDVLREYGNMSSATIFFVLERILRSEQYGKIFACAFGPGLTVEAGVLEKVR